MIVPCTTLGEARDVVVIVFAVPSSFSFSRLQTSYFISHTTPGWCDGFLPCLIGSFCTTGRSNMLILLKYVLGRLNSFLKLCSQIVDGRRVDRLFFAVFRSEIDIDWRRKKNF